MLKEGLHPPPPRRNEGSYSRGRAAASDLALEREDAGPGRPVAGAGEQEGVVAAGLPPPKCTDGL